MPTRYGLTLREFEIGFGPGMSRATVPAGTRVVYYGIVRSTGAPLWFVDQFDWMRPHSIELHDATYYGIPVAADNVSEG